MEARGQHPIRRDRQRQRNGEIRAYVRLTTILISGLYLVGAKGMPQPRGTRVKDPITELRVRHQEETA
jgi:hypothetical protein